MGYPLLSQQFIHFRELATIDNNKKSTNSDETISSITTSSSSCKIEDVNGLVHQFGRLPSKKRRYCKICYAQEKKRYYTTNVCLTCDETYCRSHGDNARKCWMMHVYNIKKIQK